MNATATPHRPARVVINAVHAKSGGGVTYLRNIVPRLAADARLDLHLALLEDQMDALGALDGRVRVHAFPVPKSNLGTIVWEQTAIPRLARALKADVIFSPANFGCLLSGRNVILLRNAFAVVGGDPRAGRWFYWSVLAVATFLSIIRSRRVLAVSNYALRALTFGLAGLLGRRATVVYHGVDPRFSPDTGAVRENFILIVADLYVQKNLLNFIRAVAIVCRQRPDVSVRIAGAPLDPWYQGQVMELVDDLGLRGKIAFLGKCAPDELRDLYRRCLFLAFPSTAETFGHPLVEAMACAAPIACSNTAAMPEIVADAALFFDPHAPEAIAAACLRMIDAPELRADLAAKGPARARDFSWDKAARETADALLDAARIGN